MTTSWRSLLGKLEDISRGTGKAAWESAKIIRDLWNDKTFLAEGCDNKLDDMTEKLAAYAGRFALGVNDMIQMIEHFPDLKDWDRGRLDLLRDKTSKLLIQKRSGDSAEKAAQKRRAVSLAQHEAVLAKLREVQAENRRLRAEVKELIQAVGRKASAKS